MTLQNSFQTTLDNYLQRLLSFEEGLVASVPIWSRFVDGDSEAEV